MQTDEIKWGEILRIREDVEWAEIEIEHNWEVKLNFGGISYYAVKLKKNAWRCVGWTSFLDPQFEITYQY